MAKEGFNVHGMAGSDMLKPATLAMDSPPIARKVEDSKARLGEVLDQADAAKQLAERELKPAVLGERMLAINKEAAEKVRLIRDELFGQIDTIAGNTLLGSLDPDKPANRTKRSPGDPASMIEWQYEIDRTQAALASIKSPEHRVAVLRAYADKVDDSPLNAFMALPPIARDLLIPGHEEQVAKLQRLVLVRKYPKEVALFVALLDVNHWLGHNVAKAFEKVGATYAIQTPEERERLVARTANLRKWVDVEAESRNVATLPELLAKLGWTPKAA